MYYLKFQTCSLKTGRERCAKVTNFEQFLATRESDVCTKFYVRSLKNCGRYVLDLHTPFTKTVHSDRRVKQEKPGVNHNMSPGSVLVSIQYGLVKPYSLVISTGL